MTGFRFSRRAAQVLAAALLTASAFGGNAAAQVTEQEAKRQVEEAYDVEVLKVSEGEIDGRAVWLVTVMLPEGNFNSAFMVSRLAVDRASGELVPSFRHRESGYDLPGGVRGDKTGLRPDVMGGPIWR
ncbi:MAG: hypothetical protein R3285_04840 [Kiloniellales bacterium]|nr:hypothetical protein [Kiloniellales bacterium]